MSRVAWNTPVSDPARIDKDFLRELMILCHPDKHANGKLSQKVWGRLAEIKNRLDNISAKEDNKRIF